MGFPHHRAADGCRFFLLAIVDTKAAGESQVFPQTPKYPLVMTNIAIENDPCVVDFPNKHGDFP